MNCGLMKAPKRKRSEAVFLALALGVSLTLPAKAAEPRWPVGSYTYLVVDQDLRGVLQQFGRTVNVPVRLSDDIEPHRLKGKLGAPTAKAFLQWVCDRYQLVWYFDGAAIRVWPQSVMQNAYLELGPVSLDDLRQRLVNSSIADERFPLNPTGDPAIVSLLAPPLYTAIVREIAVSMKSAATAAPKMSKLGVPERNIMPQDASGPALPAAQASPGAPALKTNARMSTAEKAPGLDPPAGTGANDQKIGVLIFRGGKP